MSFVLNVNSLNLLFAIDRHVVVVIVLSLDIDEAGTPFPAS